MANQNLQPNQVPEDNEKESGKFLSSNGKIFLVVIFLVAQAILAYFFTSENYYNVNEWVNADESSASYYEITDVIVNPAGTYGERYLLVSVGLELENEDSREDLEANKAMIRDRINEILSRQTVSDLNSVAGRDTLKSELGIMINDILGDNSVQNLFFTEYVMQ